MAAINGIGTGGIRVPGELPDPNRVQGANTPFGTNRASEPSASGQAAETFDANLTRGLSAVTDTEASRPSGFTETMGDLIGDVNRLQHRSDDTFRAFLRGQAELHDVALASHEASIAMRLTAEIRNKLIDAYREIMRTPM